MENSSFNTVVICDSRINDISTKLDVVVAKGSASSTYQSFPAQSASNTNINFNVVVPSENIIIDREVTWTSDVAFRITVPANTVETGSRVMSYGVTEALKQFPRNSLLTNSTCTINTSSTSVNTQDIMHCLLRATDDEVLSKYRCPHMSDKRFKKYSDMSLTESNPLGSFKNAKGKLIPRGSHPIKFSIAHTTAEGLQPLRTELSTDAEITTALTCVAKATDSWVIDISYTSTEPLLFLSPFVFGEKCNNNAGLYGVNNMNFCF